MKALWALTLPWRYRSTCDTARNVTLSSPSFVLRVNIPILRTILPRYYVSLNLEVVLT